MNFNLSARSCFFVIAICFLTADRCLAQAESATQNSALTITWKENKLLIHGEHFPGKKIEVWYLEAYCRPGSHDADWTKHTVLPHQTRMVWSSADNTKIKLQCKLSDGVIVDHIITAYDDNVDFQLTAKNPTENTSEAHWAQPCIRVGDFTGLGDPKNPRSYEYLKKSFVFQNGELQTMPTKDWSTKAKYTPGQVWRAPNVKASDVNPRPLNPNVPDNGLIGCFSKDNKLLMATAWDPYQELFQGVITCLHSDFRIGGIKPGESKKIQGKIYILQNDTKALLKRYKKDFVSKRSNRK